MRSREDPPRRSALPRERCRPAACRLFTSSRGQRGFRRGEVPRERRPYPGDRGHRLLPERTGCRAERSVFERFAKLRPAVEHRAWGGRGPGTDPCGMLPPPERGRRPRRRAGVAGRWAEGRSRLSSAPLSPVLLSPALPSSARRSGGRGRAGEAGEQRGGPAVRKRRPAARRDRSGSGRGRGAARRVRLW